MFKLKPTGESTYMVRVQEGAALAEGWVSITKYAADSEFKADTDGSGMVCAANSSGGPARDLRGIGATNVSKAGACLRPRGAGAANATATIRADATATT